MSKLLLVLAMVVSLWPAGVLAATIANGDSTNSSATSADESSVTSQTSDSGGGSSAGTSSQDQQWNTARAALDKLSGREHRLLKRMEASSSIHGTADPALAASAGRLAGAFGTWRTSYGDLDRSASRWALVNQRLSSRVREFANSPSQQRLDAVNAAIAAHNREVKRGG